MILCTNIYVKQNILIIYLVDVLRGSCHLLDHLLVLTLKKRLNSPAVKEMSFSTSVTLGVLLIVTFHEKDLLGGEGAV